MDYDLLRKKVEASKLGITGVFKKLNMTRGSFYYALENKSLKVETLEKICKVLGVSVSDFFVNGIAGKHATVSEPPGAYNTADCAECHRLNEMYREQYEADRANIKALHQLIDVLNVQLREKNAHSKRK